MSKMMPKFSITFHAVVLANHHFAKQDFPYAIEFQIKYTQISVRLYPKSEIEQHQK